MDSAKEFAEVIDLVERGLRTDRLDPPMLATAGQCFAWFGHDLPKGIAYLDEAIAINPIGLADSPEEYAMLPEWPTLFPR